MMKLKSYLPKIITLTVFVFFINLLTVLIGEDISSLTVVNMTDFRIDVLVESKVYSAVEPGYAIVHTTDPKASIDVTVQYTAGQAISGSVTRTIDLPYSSRNETCECDENSSPRCITYPEEGGSAKWEVYPGDFPGTQTGNHRADIWINDTLMIEDFAVRGPENFGDFAILGTNFGGTGTSTVYFDNIRILCYPGPHFLDDFESYGTGSYPSANWVNRFSGESAQISATVAYAGGKSFQLISRPTWARVDAYLLPTYLDSIVYEGQVYLDQAGRGAQIGFGAVESSNTYKMFNTITFSNDNLVYFSGEEASPALKPWVAQRWYKIRVLCRFNLPVE